jgi:hypothetical protein
MKMPWRASRRAAWPSEALYHLFAGCGEYLEALTLVREAWPSAPCAKMERMLTGQENAPGD